MPTDQYGWATLKKEQMIQVTCLVDQKQRCFFFFFFLMNGNTERTQCALSWVCIPRKRKRKAMKRVKQKHKISKNGNKKIMPSGPKVVIDLPFEERKIEGSRKYRRERAPKAGSRREEAITEPINSLIGEFHTTAVGKWCLPCGTWPSHWRWNTGSQCFRAVTEVTVVEKR